MSTHDTQPAPEVESKKPDATRAPQRVEPARPPALDFAKLDLRVEKVEERISPSETNVFDK